MMKRFNQAGEARATARLKKLKERRKGWLAVHLRLGLTLGLLLSLYGLTGSILVFHDEIDGWLNPELSTVIQPNDDPQYKSLEEIFQADRQVMPEQAVHSFSDYPYNDIAIFKLFYPITSAGITEDWEVYVDPYTAKVVGKRLMGSSDSVMPKTFMGFIFKLHYALLLKPEISSIVVGVPGALLIISVLAGLIVGWPLTGRWLQKRRGARKKNHNHGASIQVQKCRRKTAALTVEEFGYNREPTNAN